MPTAPTKERRRHRRIGAELPIQFEVLSSAGEPGRALHTLTTTLSCSGVGFRSPVSLPIHTRLHLHLDLPGFAQTLTAQAHIVWISGEERPTEGLEYGIEFDNIDDTDALTRFVAAIDIVPLLQAATTLGATGMHLCAGVCPMFRIRRELVAGGDAPIDGTALEAMLLGLITNAQRTQLNAHRHLSIPLWIPEVGRFRTDLHYQRGQLEAAFRPIEQYVPTTIDLGLPDSIRALIQNKSGLVLVTGPARTGKSTTLATLIDLINEESAKVIVSLETAMIYTHRNKHSLVKQREVNVDVPSLPQGIREAFAQDPDVIVIDSMEDIETYDLVVRATEMNCLTLAAIQASNAVEAINRLVLGFPREQRAVALHVLATGLRGIVTQRLLPTRDGGNHVLASEVLVPSDAIRQAIRTGQTEHIPHLLSTTAGAQTLEHSLRNLVVRGLIEPDTAYRTTNDPEHLRRLMS